MNILKNKTERNILKQPKLAGILTLFVSVTLFLFSCFSIYITFARVMNLFLLFFSLMQLSFFLSKTRRIAIKMACVEYFFMALLMLPFLFPQPEALNSSKITDLSISVRVFLWSLCSIIFLISSAICSNEK